MTDTTARPGFTVHICVAVTCGTCQCAYGDDDDGFTAHFATQDDAATTVTDAGWWVTLWSVQCPDCAADQACAELGHAWPDWHTCGCGCAAGHPRIPAHTRPTIRRVCQSCQQDEERVA
jgi:hypothetical protein